MSDMVLGIATRHWEGWQRCAMSWSETAGEDHLAVIVGGMDVLPAFQTVYERSKHPIIAYIHDDVMLYEQNWDLRVLKEFEDPGVGIVGFGGALGHGQPHLYKVPYHLPDLARQQFLSNMRSAETHGDRFRGACDVAVLDGFALFVRRTVLDRWGGWPVSEKIGYFMYSESICCEARRQVYRIQLVVVE
jgi:hypothetical protein